MKKIVKTLKSTATIIFILLSGQAFAKQESPKIEDIWQLKSEILDLKSRMDALEKANKTAAPATVSDTPQGKAAWRRLAKGMSKSQVINILGTPEKITTGYLDYFYYPSGGKVTFEAPGVVYGWDEP